MLPCVSWKHHSVRFLQKDDEADEDLPELSREELNELYEAIPEFIEVYDQDGILRLL